MELIRLTTCYGSMSNRFVDLNLSKFGRPTYTKRSNRASQLITYKENTPIIDQRAQVKGSSKICKTDMSVSINYS